VTTVEDPGGANIVASETRDESRKGAFGYGLSAGLGFDWEVFPQLFLRAEYEYLALAAVEDIKISIHTARAGVGVKF
jgi:opacity protein-like surface antigen